MANGFVKERLRSPASAKFPSSPIAAQPLDENRFVVVGEVDSQNGYGAMVRSRYSATVRCDPAARRWHLEDINIK